MVNYPNSIDTDLTLPPLDGYQSPFGNPTVEDLRQAIFAIETELGIVPAGAYADVRTRLDILETRIGGGGEVFVAGGDLSGSIISQTVIGIQGNPISVPTGTNTVLTWTGSALVWDTASGGVSTIENQGTPIAGGPFSTLNFTGAGVVASNAGGGVATITIAGGGSSVTWANDLVNSSNTHQYVSSLSYNGTAGGGVIGINGTGTSLVFANNNAGPLITQDSIAGNGVPFTISAQPSSTSNDAAGNLLLEGGTNTFDGNAPASLLLGGGNRNEAASATITLGVDGDGGQGTFSIVANDGQIVNVTGGQISVSDMAGFGAGFVAVSNTGVLSWSAGSDNVVVFQPGGVASGNVYITWAAAYTALTAINGPRIVYFDDTFMNPIIPPGTYTIGSYTRFVGALRPNQTILQIQEGATFDVLADLENLSVQAQNTATTIVTYASGSFALRMNNTDLIAGSAPFFSITGSGSLFAELLGSRWVLSNSAPAPVVVMNGGSDLILNLFSASLSQIPSSIQSGAVTDDGSCALSVVIDDIATYNTQPGFTGSLFYQLLSVASKVSYSPVTPSNWGVSPPTNVNGAIDQLANRPFNVQQTTKTAPYFVDSGGVTDFIIYCNGTGITITLSAPTAGRYLIIKDISGSASTNPITIDPNASETIDGASSATINVNFGSLGFTSDGTNWWIL